MDEWEQGWLKHWSKAGARGYELPKTGPGTEEAAFRRLAQAGVVTTSIASIAGQLAGDFTQPKAGQALGILYEMASA